MQRFCMGHAQNKAGQCLKAHSRKNKTKACASKYRLWKRFACPNKKILFQICCKEAAFAAKKPHLQVRSRICKYEAVFAQVRLRTCPNFLSWRQEMEEGRTVTKIWLNPFGYPQAQPEAINNGCVWQSRGLYTSCALLSIKMMLLSVTVAGARSAVLKINVCCCRSCCAETKCK